MRHLRCMPPAKTPSVLPGLASALAAWLALNSVVFAAEPDATRPEAGTRIVGSDEAPAVLNIVPWQERELGAAPDQITTPVGSVLDEALQPVDRAELQRELEYLKVLQHRSTVTENKR